MNMIAMPRAINGVRASIDVPPAVRAAGDQARILADITDAFGKFREKHDSRMDSVEAAIDRLMEGSAYATLGGGGGSSIVAADPDYSGSFAAYFRKGDDEAALKAANAEGHRAQVQAAMSVGDSSSGGYLAPVEWDRRIAKAQQDKSPMRRIANVQTTSVGAYSTLWNNEGWGSGWVGETAARPETTSASMASVTFGAGEIYAMPAITQRLLDDAGIDVQAWLTAELEDEFNRQEGVAFISGNGTNKPFGLLQYITGGAAETQHPGGTLNVMPSGDAATIPDTDTLVTFVYGLGAPYRRNATWLMNSQTAATIAKMKDGNGNYIWRESFIVGQPATLLGRPVEIDESMPDIGAGALPIAFGDFKAGYLINDRLGTRILRDPYSSKPFVLFYCTKRVGGGVSDPNAIRLLKIAAS